MQEWPKAGCKKPYDAGRLREPGRRGDVEIGYGVRNAEGKLHPDFKFQSRETVNASVRCQSCILAVGSQEHGRSSAAAQDLIKLVEVMGKRSRRASLLD